MWGITLATKGYISRLIRRTVVPLQLQIKSTSILELDIKNRLSLNADITNIIDKNVNLKLTDKNINIKKADSTDINIDTQ